MSKVLEVYGKIDKRLIIKTFAKKMVMRLGFPYVFTKQYTIEDGFFRFVMITVKERDWHAWGVQFHIHTIINKDPFHAVLYNQNLSKIADWETGDYQKGTNIIESENSVKLKQGGKTKSNWFLISLFIINFDLNKKSFFSKCIFWVKLKNKFFLNTFKINKTKLNQIILKLKGIRGGCSVTQAYFYFYFFVNFDFFVDFWNKYFRNSGPGFAYFSYPTSTKEAPKNFPEFSFTGNSGFSVCLLVSPL